MIFSFNLLYAQNSLLPKMYHASYGMLYYVSKYTWGKILNLSEGILLSSKGCKKRFYVNI